MSAPSHDPKRARATRWPALYLTLLLGCAAGLGVLAHRERHRDLDRGRELWRDRCSQCHTLLRTLAPRSPREWAETIDRMLEKPGAEVRKDEARLVRRFLVEANSLPGAYRRGYWLLRTNREGWRQLYETKCGRCHGIDIVPRAREDAGYLYWCMERDRRRNVFWLSVSDKQQIFDYLHLGDVTGPVDYFRGGCASCHSHRFALSYFVGWTLPREEARTDARGLFAKRCFECHTETILDEGRSRDDWRKTVERMHEKAPGLIAEAEIAALVDFLARERPPGAGVGRAERTRSDGT